MPFNLFHNIREKGNTGLALGRSRSIMSADGTNIWQIMKVLPQPAGGESGFSHNFVSNEKLYHFYAPQWNPCRSSTRADNSDRPLRTYP